jgi:hypothetical protein
MLARAALLNEPNERNKTMSVERDYRLYVKQYHQGINDKGEVDLKFLLDKYKIPQGTARDVVDDTKLRAAISKRLGAVEEQAHKTFLDENNSNQRRNIVPGRIAPFHNRLVDELYHAATPPEPAVTATSVDADTLDLA